jgi:Eukaryotic elongation factor 5A hypusine, DNA-binding OB fold
LLFSSYREPERRFSEKVEKVEFDADFPQHRHQERELPIRRPAAEFGPSEASFVKESSSSRHIPTVVDTFERRYSEPREDVRVEIEATVDAPVRHTKSKMGYYDDEGRYHSFRHGIHKAADRILHPFHPHYHPHDSIHEDIHIDARIQETGPSSSISRGLSRRGVETVPIPCHHVRTGDILYLQGRPCQVIRITTSAQTGQHRYLGVDLFTKQLHEDTSIVSHPSPSVLLQTMQGPIFKQYRLLDVREDGRVVAMTENGDVKQSLRVADQGSLWARLNDAFADGRGSVRVLVLRDGPDELAVDFKLVHGSRL